MSSAVLLLSSGLDSTVNLFASRKEGIEIKLALTFDYGQRAANREIEQARKLSDLLQVPHEVVQLPWFKNISASALVNRVSQVPTGQDVSIDDLKTSNETAKAVWVPNRNGVFLNVAAAYAEALSAAFVIPGFNIEEATTFPDNSKDFLQATDHALGFSTAIKVKTKCFTTDLNKTQIVGLGSQLGVPFELVWPCYFGDEQPCGECESCQRFRRAMKAAEVSL